MPQCDHPRHQNPGLITDCPQCVADRPHVGFVITLPEASGAWMYAGQTVDEVLNVLRAEIDASEDAPEDFDRIAIEKRRFSQAELDNMPEFPGW